jgi:ADP-ribose pyrophosphatase
MNKTDLPVPRRLELRELAAGEWLRLQKVTYLDYAGVERDWEAVGRQRRQGAVVILTRLRPSGRIVMVQQYRPPADAQVLEFPAGLIDPEETPEATAVRELREETGYHGVLKWISRPCLSSPGMSGEHFYTAVMEVDETLPANRNPTTDWDEGENICTFCVAPADVPAFLRGRLAAGVLLDGKLTAYFLGMGMEW